MVFPIIAALCAGGCIVTSRMINASLSNKIGLLQSTFFNFIVGLTFSSIILWFSPETLSASFPLLKAVPTWAIFSGSVGVLVVLLSNLTSLKTPALTLTLLIFIGQMAAGMIIDAFMTGVASPVKILGMLLIFFGLLLNSKLDACTHPQNG